MIKGYRIRIYPNKEQKILIEKHMGCCRFIWNYMLNLQNENYKEKKEYLSRFDMINLLPKLKKEDNYVVTKGDSNNNVDNPVKYDMVVGRVVKIIRNVGVWQKVIMTPKVFISILITFMLFSIYFSKRGRDVNG